jgi:hypothetical protein
MTCKSSGLRCYSINVTNWWCTRIIASLPDVIISITTHPTIVRTFSGGILCPSQIGQVVVHLGDGKTSWQPCHPRQSVLGHLLPMFCPAWVNVWILQFIICLNSSILCFQQVSCFVRGRLTYGKMFSSLWEWWVYKTPFHYCRWLQILWMGV